MRINYPDTNIQIIRRHRKLSGTLIELRFDSQHKIGHFGDVLPSQYLGSVLKNTTKANMHV